MVSLFMMANRVSSYKVEFKIQAVEWLRSHSRNISGAAWEFGVDRKRIREWDQQYSRLLQHNVGSAKKKRKMHPGRPPMSSELDKAVFDFLEDERSEGRVVTNKMLLRRAREIAGGMGITERFKASDMWLRCWKRRFGVGMRAGTNASQRVPSDFVEQLQDFRRSVIKGRKAHKIEPADISNMDQTMVRFDMPRGKTNNVRGQKDIRIKTTKAEKKGFTVALATTAAGEKLPAVIFFKEKGGVLGSRVR